MEKIEYRYRYQARRTMVLLVDSEGHHVAEALYNGPINDFGVKLPVKWKEDIDDNTFDLPIFLPVGCRAVIWPANEKEEIEEICILSSIWEIQAWADTEITIFSEEDDTFYMDLLKKILKNNPPN